MTDHTHDHPKINKDQFFINRLALAYQIKSKPSLQKLKKYIYDNPQYKQAMDGFLRDQNFIEVIYTNIVGTDQVAIYHESPTPDRFKRKGYVILRINDGPVDANTFNNDIIYIQMTKNALQHLYLMNSQVLGPVMQNPDNQQGWTDLVTKDLMERFNAYVAQVYVMIGLNKGRTMLPLPNKKLINSDGSEKDKAHIFEGSIITWTKQIKNVLKLEPQQALKAGNNPGPMVELRFWENKAANLNSIYEQLQSVDVKTILRFLQRSKSTYTNPFTKLQKQVQESRVEANDNFRFLSTLKELFQTLGDISGDFISLHQIFPPIMHTCLLIYQHSKFYNTPPRLVVLIKQICNAIITRANDYINGNQVAAALTSGSQQVVEVCKKLQITIDICTKFKDAYFEYRAKAQNQWKLTLNALFSRLDAYTQRCHDIHHLTTTIIQFNRLQKIQLGGTKGKILTQTIKQISQEFKKAVDNFRQLPYDTMDINVKNFDEDFLTFRNKIKELQRRLASVITQGFDDNDTISGKYKLLDCFEGILNRSIIQDELQKKHAVLLEMYKQDLKTVQSIFLQGKALIDKNDQRSPIYNNYPPIAGTLTWCKGLKDRISEPFDKLATLGQGITDREQYKDVQKLYTNILKTIKDYQQSKLLFWQKQVQESSQEKLKQALLCKDENGLLKVNFDPALVRLLRQVKYLKLLSMSVPTTAQNIFEKVNTYRYQTVSLDMIVQNYNKIITCLNEVQEPLVKKRILAMDKDVEPGIITYKWKSPEINDFIKKAKDTVDSLYQIVDKMKKSLDNITNQLLKFKKPMVQRKNKPISPQQYDNILRAVIANKLSTVKQCGAAVHKQLKQVNDAVKIDRKLPEWKNYTQYINTIVIDGIAASIVFALDHLNEQINSKKTDQSPLFQIKMELEGKKGVVFEPQIEQQSQGIRVKSVRDTIKGWINQIFSISHTFPRLDTVGSTTGNQSSGDYILQVKDNFIVRYTISEITINLDIIENQTKEIKEQFRKKYNYLWQIDPKQSFEKFLKDNEPTDEKVEGDQQIQKTNILLQGCREKIPDLQLFDKKITQLKQIQIDISKITTPVQKYWLKIDLRSLIKALEVRVSSWIKVYTDFLINEFKTTHKNLKQFISRTNQGLKVNPKDVMAQNAEEQLSEKQKQKNRKLLMNVMKHISQVKEVKNKIDSVVDRMKNMVIKLKKHAIPIMQKGEEDPLQSIQNANAAFNQTDKKVNEIKKDILSLIVQQAIQIKKKLDDFTKQVEAFKIDFKSKLPYTYEDGISLLEIQNKYKIIDQYYLKLQSFEHQARQNAQLQNLFQLDKRQYKPLKQCYADLKNLKILWDMISLVNLQYNDWKGKLWRQIKAQTLIQQNKAFQTQIKSINKEVKAFSGCKTLDSKAQNMNTVLSLVQNLRGDYMEDRHWKHLKQKTRTQFDQKSPNFTFDDILKIKLYNFKPDVEEIVDIAMKQAKIDKKLKIIENNWSKMNFEFQPYKQLYVFAPLDNMIEVLDANSLDLMGMKAQGKYVQFFIKIVEDWREKLGRVDVVVNQWLKVQKNWRILVNIFLGSEDIRMQLPEDTKVFEGVNSEFVEIMTAAHQSPLIIDNCTDARKQSLVQMSQKIKKCQKALNDYLEQKKKIFPRFYFLSNQSLLTILSNGQNPPKVCQFIGDCFDGLKTLQFQPPENPNQISKTAIGMYSKDDQLIPFSSKFVAEGQVELWLKQLQQKMRQQLYYILCDAKNTSDTWDQGTDKPRQEWIRDYCAQIALLTTQLVWTEDVNRAFQELSSGAESAMKQCVETIKTRITKLIFKVTRPLDILQRMKVINIITIDVHSRDVVQNLYISKISQAESFSWQSQLKFQWSLDKNNDVTTRQFCRFDWQKDPKKFKCIIKIVDWFRFYSYEYVGNVLRLVITPLTDRCYITLTQALNLVMGGAPAGPAGTGKTQTVKDLGRAVGLPVIVFNCSDQMTKDSMAQIFMGLCQSGAWGCFDEFNRIAIQVLSVISTQVKTCLDAQKQKKKKFIFLQQGEISLEDSAGFFITMNPGYAGRTQLPDNLKALFRSCAMVVPDLVLICENMLMSEGFALARDLSKKFVALYLLSKELLSKQRHYDWGLRAVKSVLRQAGKLKREPSNLNIPEDPLLMRALRDFNIPKIVTDDKPIFLRLIQDLFPNATTPAKQASALTKLCEYTTKTDMGLYYQQAFVKKCIDLSEILEVRHCMFIIGPPGCGKTTVWKTMLKTHINNKEDGEYDTLNPKALTAAELFGTYTKSKQWKNGVLAVIMKNQNKCEQKYKHSHKHKWTILDGDVDPEWIESLNTVMDDNKVLTLVSNDRIPLTPSMRLLFQVSNLKNATPATVSRGGVLFINDNDIGWMPFMNSWLERSQPYMKNEQNALEQNYPVINEVAKSVFFRCFQSYIDTPSDLQDQVKITYLAPHSTMGAIQSICTILDGLLIQHQTTINNLYSSKDKQEDLKNLYESFFIFAVMWAWGGSVGGGQDDNQVLNKFSSVWKSLSKIKFPQQGLCYDYYWNLEENKWAHWSARIPHYVPTDEAIFSKIYVSTIHTTRLRYLLNIHLRRKKPCLFVGGPGTGKTQVIKDYLASTKPEQVAHRTINFSSFTDATSLQKNIQSMLDKKSGKTYGSAMNKILIAFIDDLNMPYVDKYGTQSPIQLLRQIIDYGSIFNREQLEQRKYIQDLLIFACLNHKSGSFTIDLRLQKNFSTFTMYTPTEQIIKTIFGNILGSHLAGPGFEEKVKNISDKIIDSTVSFFTRTIKNPQFSPSAKKFHYQFNFRELANIVQGVMRSVPQLYRTPLSIIRLWIHETRRVFEDRFINDDDLNLFRTFVRDSVVKSFGQINQKENPFQEPLIFTSFMNQNYTPVKDMIELRRTLKDKLDQYNDLKAQMNLVLFDQAIEHVCKICRIIALPSGHALLVGVGGSGKQSLAKLATFIIGYQIQQMVVTQSFNMNDLRSFLSQMYRKISKPNANTRIYMITDSQIKDDAFLIPINDMLNSGFIADLFPKEDFQALVNNLRNQAKGNGIVDTQQNLFNYFYDKMKKNLKIILCFSPVGQAMRIRARKFPGIINATSIDWFHPWPKNALIDVANKFLQQTELESEELREKIAINMAETHVSIDQANIKFKKLERRNNYTTPKSFLELISFYKTLLDSKRGQIDRQIKRYLLGLQILDETKSKVQGLQQQLKVKMVEVDKKRQQTDKLIEKVSHQSAITQVQQKKANEQEEKTNIQKDGAEKLAYQCKIALDKAEPALLRAAQAVNCLKKPHITQMKNLGSPPTGVILTARVVLGLFGEKISPNDPDQKVWKKSQQAMNQPQKFLERVTKFDGRQIDTTILDNVNKIIQDPAKKYNEEDMKGQNYAASKLCAWSTNIVTYNRIYKEVRPLQLAKDKANEQLQLAMKQLAKVKQQVRKLTEMVDALRKQLAQAQQQKRIVQQDAQNCQNKLNAAQKLVNGLAGENKRWGENVQFLQANIKSVIGDVLLASAFVSYIGAFSAKLRLGLWKSIWLPDIINKQIPMTQGVEPLKILTTEAIKAKWRNEGLPADTMSLQNAAIISSCSRWPLLIDPQLQGSGWIRGSQGQNLAAISINQKNWMRELTKNISDGKAVLLEGIQQQIEATLQPLLTRAITKKGASYYLEMGSDVIDYDPKFKLFLMTKLYNPHFRPQIAAQCTIINFIVTQSGLEEQLLAMVVNAEKNQLQVQKQELVKLQNMFQVELDRLQSQLLKELSDANPATILQNRQLIEKLDITKKTAISIQEQSQKAKKTEISINAQRQIYRPVAGQGAMLYFLLITLCIIDHMYQYSLEGFIRFFFKAIDRTVEKDETRIPKLIQNIRITIYQWVSRGLFEKHRIIFLTQIVFRLMQKKQIQVNYTPDQMDFLIKAIPRPGVQNNLDWLPNTAWDLVQGLIQLQQFKLFAQNMEKDAPNRFKDWYNELTPQQTKLPLDWKKLDTMPFKKLLVIRCLRPDRITVALTKFIKQTLPKGEQFVDMDSKSSFIQILSSAITDSEPQTPIFFILSPGADPVKQVQKIIKRDKDKYRIQPGKSFFNISLGQGQDQIARRRIEQGNKQGHWVMLQNIHLMPRWLIELQKILDAFTGEAGGSHANFRLLLSAEPSQGVPIGILDRSIKLTNEPPAGLKANMKRAFTYFPKQQIEQKQSKIKSIYFGLCFFHSTVIERKRFGPKGWNMSYPFNVGDLRDSYYVLNRYMDSNSGSSKIPFEDLIYIFGQIMYGGHIVDDWDRRLARAYLQNIMTPQIFEQQQLFPYIEGKNLTFKVPAPTNFEKYIEHIQLSLGQQTPLAYGLHPNAQIGFRTTQCYTLFNTLLQLAPRDASTAQGSGIRTTQQILQGIIKRFLEQINFRSMIFSVDDIKNKMDADQKGPYQNVFIQQIEYMSILLTQMARSVEEIDQGLKGLLTISEQMQQTMDALVLNRVPVYWANLAYPSKRGLQSWIVNLLKRIQQLNAFRDDPLTLPRVIMVSRFFNPQSYLTAIKQVIAALHKGLQLNKLYIQTDVTKKTIQQIDSVAKDGSYVFGFILQGARWDVALGLLDQSKPKQMFSVIPVVYCKAVPLPPEGKQDKSVYQCPAYKTEDRSSTYVFTAQLKTRAPPRKWILAGVAIIMDVQGVSDESTQPKKQSKDKK